MIEEEPVCEPSALSKPPTRASPAWNIAMWEASGLNALCLVEWTMEPWTPPLKEMWKQLLPIDSSWYHWKLSGKSAVSSTQNTVITISIQRNKLQFMFKVLSLLKKSKDKQSLYSGGSRGCWGCTPTMIWAISALLKLRQLFISSYIQSTISLFNTSQLSNRLSKCKTWW